MNFTRWAYSSSKMSILLSYDKNKSSLQKLAKNCALKQKKTNISLVEMNSLSISKDYNPP
jgi:hypothetical protein